MSSVELRVTKNDTKIQRAVTERILAKNHYFLLSAKEGQAGDKGRRKQGTPGGGTKLISPKISVSSEKSCVYRNRVQNPGDPCVHRDDGNNLFGKFEALLIFIFVYKPVQSCHKSTSSPPASFLRKQETPDDGINV
jgi:hypothetical protein